MASDTVCYYRCTACCECFFTSAAFIAHAQSVHCKVLVCQGHDPGDSMTFMPVSGNLGNAGGSHRDSMAVEQRDYIDEFPKAQQQCNRSDVARSTRQSVLHGRRRAQKRDSLDRRARLYVYKHSGDAAKTRAKIPRQDDGVRLEQDGDIEEIGTSLRDERVKLSRAMQQVFVQPEVQDPAARTEAGFGERLETYSQIVVTSVESLDECEVVQKKEPEFICLSDHLFSDSSCDQTATGRAEDSENPEEVLSIPAADAQEIEFSQPFHMSQYNTREPSAESAECWTNDSGAGTSSLQEADVIELQKPVCELSAVRRRTGVSASDVNTQSEAVASADAIAYLNKVSENVWTRNGGLVRKGSYFCPVCMLEYRLKGSLYKHIQQMHKEFKPLKCHVCSYAFLMRSDLNKHLRKHTGERRFQCVICQKRFLRKYHLRRHETACRQKH
ncbi:PREDICTED: zinc finger protein 561-like isoform X3 [Priapulus caudatus]|uniref:Zinc finger protein 561-like isoform X3 n=1 Tax=Priapulus caudatus TaxID=37621 RepID=A0ABM1E889_PRICU|nr:PREDICTED: zinc finger protein 561-like isoform X3 [Priapulus caudatus]